MAPASEGVAGKRENFCSLHGVSWMVEPATPLETRTPTESRVIQRQPVPDEAGA